MTTTRRQFFQIGATGFAALSSGVLLPAVQPLMAVPDAAVLVPGAPPLLAVPGLEQQPLPPPSAAQPSAPAPPPTPGQAPPPPASLPPRPPALAAELVKEYVIAGHANLPRTQELLAASPGLLNASWDWGGGDFEMAIGGAGHMGNREIALFLISRGCRMDIFVAAMLGRLDIVEPALKAFPHLVHSKGPHGIPLLAHAKKGGAPAAEVAAFVETFAARSTGY